MSVDDVQSAVSRLPTAEFERLRRWSEEFPEDRWDRQIESDIPAGRLDSVVERVDEISRLMAECRQQLMMDRAALEEKIRGQGGSE